MKVLIIVLVVVLLLFVVAIGLGAGQDHGDADLSREGIGNWLAEVFLRPVPPVPPEDVSGKCRQGTTLFLTSGSCTVTVAESSKFSRTLTLVATGGAVLVAIDRENGLDIEEDAAPGGDAEVEVDLGREGAALVVTCMALEPCALEIVS